MLWIILILTGAFAVLAWRNLHQALWLLVAVLPSYLLRIELFGLPTTLLELFIMTFLIVWFIQRRSNLHARMPHEPWTIAIALLFLTASISVFVAHDQLAALGIWKAYVVEPILLFFIVRHERIHQNLKIETLFQALGVTAIILSIIGITQWLTGAGLPIPWDIERRVTSVFDYPNALGLFLGPIIIMSVLNHFSDDRNETKVPVKFFWTVVATCSSIAIFLAQSEAAIVSVIATLLIAGFLYRKTRLLSLCFLGLSILCTLLYPPLFQKLTLQDYSGQVRLTQWNETINLLQDHWLLGVGLSGYPAALEPHHQATHLEIFQYPHNLVLNIWVELGLLGLIACLLLLWQVLSTVSRLPSTPIAFFALLQMIIHGLVDVPFLKNDLAVLTFLLLAIIFSYAHPRVPATTSR